MAAKRSPLSAVPLSSVLRSWATTSLISNRYLINPTIGAMTWLANSRSALVNPDRNKFIHFFIKSIFYNQFCAGENSVEVRATIDHLKLLGYSGVILGYGREQAYSAAEQKDLVSVGTDPEADKTITEQLTPWLNGNLDCIRFATPGDIVHIKFTGAGREATYALLHGHAPPPVIDRAFTQICEAAIATKIRIFIDAEQTELQSAIDDWALHYMARFNKTPNEVLIYNTYQCYLKATAAKVSNHLLMARDQGFTLGVKQVRGAYISTEPRGLIHDQKHETDAAYDGIANAILCRKWNDMVKGDGGAWPSVCMAIATHNGESVRKARALLVSGEAHTPVVFGQLYGVADDVSFGLISDAAEMASDPSVPAARVPKVYKGLPWGTAGECIHYLMRRSVENRSGLEAAARARVMLRAEVWRRCKAAFGAGLK